MPEMLKENLVKRERIIAPLSIIEKYNEESYELLLVIALMYIMDKNRYFNGRSPEQYIQLLKRRLEI